MAIEAIEIKCSGRTYQGNVYIPRENNEVHLITGKGEKRIMQGWRAFNYTFNVDAFKALIKDKLLNLW